MNYAYWFANIPGLSNCAKISIHEKVGNAQDIYFLSEKQMENMQLLAKEIQAVRAAQKTDMEEAYAKMCESGISFVSLEDASYPKRLRHIANPPYGLYVKVFPGIFFLRLYKTGSGIKIETRFRQIGCDLIGHIPVRLMSIETSGSSMIDTIVGSDPYFHSQFFGFGSDTVYRG